LIKKELKKLSSTIKLLKAVEQPTYTITETTKCLRLTHRLIIPTDEIIYLESEINYTNVYTLDNRKLISSFTLKKLETQIIQENFVRINRGCLVNTNHIIEVTGIKRNGYAQLSNGLVLIVSRRKFDTIKDIIDRRIQPN
jgi:DNA-binding LytR/AlgR family response regulator